MPHRGFWPLRSGRRLAYADLGREDFVDGRPSSWLEGMTGVGGLVVWRVGEVFGLDSGDEIALLVLGSFTGSSPLPLLYFSSRYACCQVEGFMEKKGVLP